ncbi:hypothetical protein [Cryobacterium sp. MLB-32]|uniref:hypothetical protein n=1 Tax=Cryobacterium sp. MLB-32 TaxID=1529318 RepID=UPI0012DFF2E1|nr:hypothetical protein [Cryobacterium sp. MLB-32]
MSDLSASLLAIAHHSSVPDYSRNDAARAALAAAERRVEAARVAAASADAATQDGRTRP